MEVQDLILADYAAANPNGKFTLVGAGFTAISARNFPCVHPLMFVLVRLNITKQDRGKNKVQISIQGESGQVFNSEGFIDVNPEYAQERCMALPVQVVNIKFDNPGDYVIRVAVNGQQSQKSQILSVRPIKAEEQK